MPDPLRLVKTRPTGHGRARGLVSSRVSGQRVEAVSYAATERFAEVVAAYWSGRWDLRGQAPHVTELLSDPCANFVFEQSGEHAGSRLVGVWTRLWKRTLEGNGHVRGVKLRAGAMRAFVQMPAFKYTNRIVPLHTTHELERAVLEPESDEEGFAALEEWLSAQRRDDHHVSLAVALVDRIMSDPEITTVERLSELGGLGPRALQRLFREYVGATPKWVIRRTRLQDVALLIERGESITLAQLAADLGYTDQAHLTRDFKSAVGKTPKEFARTVRV